MFIPSSATSDRLCPTSANTRVSEGMNCTVTFSMVFGFFWKRSNIIDGCECRRLDTLWTKKQFVSARMVTRTAIKRARIALNSLRLLVHCNR